MTLPPPVAELRSLADEPRLATRKGQLSRLADDLEAQRELPRWAQMDLMSSFVRNESISPAPTPPLKLLLDQSPTVLIFLPIFFTWTGLAFATHAYRQSRGRPALEGMSFLEQWQTGFDGALWSLLYFDRIALLTLAAIVLLVAVSVTQSLYARKIEGSADQQKNALLERLTVALTDTDFHLAEYRMNEASQLSLGAEELAKASRELTEAGNAAGRVQKEAKAAIRQIALSLERAERLAEALQVATGGVDGASTRAADAAGKITDAAGKVAHAAADLGKASGNLGYDVGQALETTGKHIRDALDGWRTEGALYSHRHEVSTDHLVHLVSELEKLLNQSNRSLDGIPQALDQLEKHSQRFDSSLGLAADKLEKHYQQVDSSITTTADRLRTHLDRFIADLPEDRSTRGDLVLNELRELRRAVERLQLAGTTAPRRRRWFG